MKIFQKGFNYSQDGDGNRLVYHLQGCNMHCPWCANPEGLHPAGALMMDREWLIPSICPEGAISTQDVNRRICENCRHRSCITEHKTKGMRLSCQEISVKELLSEAKASAMMFGDDGGVTFTGGEATVQFEELREALTALKEVGIHTALETNGSHRRLPELFGLIDQLIMDCKLVDSNKHQRYTGIPAETVLTNLRAAAHSHPYLHIRIPLIGGVNDSDQDLSDFLGFFKEIQGENVTFEILTYHEFGREKWHNCGMEYVMDQRAFISDEKARRWIQALRDGGCHYRRT